MQEAAALACRQTEDQLRQISRSAYDSILLIGKSIGNGWTVDVIAHILGGLHNA